MSDKAEERPAKEVAVPASTPPSLDISKLHALPTEQQDLYLLSYVGDLRDYVNASLTDDLPSQQPAIKKEIIKIVGLSTPIPSRIIRHTLGQISGALYTRGSRKLLHENINDLLSIINVGKSEKDLPTKHAATTCLGYIFREAGDSAISLHALVISSLLKLVKLSQSHTGFRASIFRALSFIVTGLGRGIDESSARELWKQTRAIAGSDKSALVQKTACLCLQSLVTHTSYFLNTNDFDNLKNVVWKIIENSVLATRNAAAGTLAQALLRGYSDVKVTEAAPAARKSKKSSKKQGVESDEDDMVTQKGDVHTSPRSSTTLSYSLRDLLRVVSVHYCRPATSNKARSSLAHCYRTILEGLPRKTVQDQYSEIADHFFTDILSFPSVYTNRVRLLLSRKLTDTLLNDIVGLQLLTENAQIQAARWLINDVLKNYPQVLAGRKEPSKHALSAALRALSTFLHALGPAVAIMQDSCREALFQVIVHPSYTVQVHAIIGLKRLVAACPNQLTRCITLSLSQLKKGLDGGDGRAHRRSTTYASAIAAMIRAGRSHPLYGSVEMYSELFTFATDLLKASATAELRLCSTQIQIAWTLVGGLLTLGPSFAKVHLNQLLLMWRNALPPPLTQDNSSRRSQLELSFLTHVRECALTAMLTFLTFSGNLVTTDGFKRLSVMLQNSTNFFESLPVVQQTEDISNRLIPTLQLHDHAVRLQRRLLQCTVQLFGLKQVDYHEIALQGDVAGFAIRVLIEPCRPIQKGMEATLVNSASNFEGLWDLTDNWSHGVNSSIDNYEVYLPSTGQREKRGFTDVTQSDLDTAINNAASRSFVQAAEHDAATAFYSSEDKPVHTSCTSETACITDAIQLIAATLPLQPPRIQESCLEQLATALSQPFAREPGRRLALQLNVITAILSMLAVANNETSFQPGQLSITSSSKILGEIIRRGVVDPDPILRSVASQALGRLCYLAGTQFVNMEVKNLIDTIVANREPHVRAGCALALGMIHSQVGAMAASYHLKNIVGVLLSLCSDAHPTVHFWALRGLVGVADSAGLSFSTYASSALGMLAQMYSSDQHNQESNSATMSTIEMEFETPIVLAQCVDSIINVLGPDLQDSAKSRALILNLVHYLEDEDAPYLQVQSFECRGHISLYAPAHVQLSSYVHNLQRALTSNNALLEKIAVEGLENMIKRNASEVARVANPGLLESLWLKLDENVYTVNIINSIRQWMQQTCLTETSQWLEKCQNILSRTRLASEPVKVSSVVDKPQQAVPDLADEEVAGFAAAAAAAEPEKPGVAAEGQEFLRWQTRNFAMSLLSEMLDVVKMAMLPDQVIEAEAVLQSKVGDIVRVAFSASTANVVNLRVQGLHILDQVLRLFGRTPDPDFLEASLLEQYQAQISSALTPAFAVDSSPELAAEAITVCATFVGTGIVTSVERMGRIFKVLSAGLENLAQDKPEPSVGDLKDLTPNAQALLKMSLLSSWAQLELATTEQTYLEDVVHPYVSRLAPLWLTALQEFAGLRFEPEISDSLGDYSSNDPQERYAALNREVRLVFYQRSWLNIVDAVALLVEKDSNAVFDALDNKKSDISQRQTNGDRSGDKDMNFREEPVAFFFILFGLAFEALVTQARDNRTQTLAILSALRRILTPIVSGNAVYQDAVFDELTDTLNRLALTSTTEVQSILVSIARNLSMDHVVAKSEDRNDKLSDDIEQLFELTRVIILVLAGLVPTLEESPSHASRPLNEDNISLIQTCFQSLVDVADVFPAVIRTDLHASIMHCYCTMLATAACQHEVVPRIIPSFRMFMQSIVKAQDNGSSRSATSQLVTVSLSRMLAILAVAQRRENEYSIICARNTLLSMTVLLTIASSTIPAKSDLIGRTLSALLETLQDVGLGKTAANCARSLLLASPKSSTDEVISSIIWPRVLILVMDKDAEDPELVKTALMQALVTSVSTLRAPTARSAAVTILLPCLLYRAQTPVPNGSTEDLSKESAARLLELAGIDGTAFRNVVGQLAHEQRTQLQALLQSGVGSKNVRNGIRSTASDESIEEAEERAPAIELRMDF